MGPLLPQGNLGSDEGVVDDIEDMRIVSLEERHDFVELRIVQEQPKMLEKVFSLWQAIPLLSWTITARMRNIIDPFSSEVSG